MLRSILTAIILIATLPAASSQTVKYFRFSRHGWQGCGWLDSSFVAATSDTAIIRSVRAHLALPVSQRWLLSGYIAPGNGGYNHNADHWFNWHFIPGWHLAGMEVEVCDGCATYLDNNPRLLAGDTVQFCPFGSYPTEELVVPTAIEKLYSEADIQVFPVPASSTIYFRFSGPSTLTVTFYDFLGRRHKTIQTQSNAPNSLGGLVPGSYLLRMELGDLVSFQRLVIM